MLGSATQNKGWHLFDLGGHRIYMQPWFLLLIAFFAFAPISARAHGLLSVVTNVFTWGPVLFFGILLHEFGHAAALKYFKHGSSTIVLQGFGGVTINQRRGRNPPGESIIISLAGPFASLVTAFTFGGLMVVAQTTGLLASEGFFGQFANGFLWTMFIANLVWAIFNLLPINPLDGGHVVLHALRSTFGNRAKAMYYTAIVSLVVLGATVVGALAYGIGGFLLIAIGLFLGIQNFQILKAAGNAGPPRGPGGRGGRGRI